MADSQFGLRDHVTLANVEFEVMHFQHETTVELCRLRVWDWLTSEYDGCLLVLGYNDLVKGESLYTTIAKTNIILNHLQKRIKNVMVTMSPHWSDTQKQMFETAFYQYLLRGCYSDYQGSHFAQLAQLQFHWHLKHKKP
ncbi:MAG: hypothetical protein K0U52_06200 [Gammaproteobacteria bacterium]|nr:hypothetical protein [Gammaproteobacteria bacterium]